MKIAIITHVPHIIEGQKYFAYAPYILEMNIWSKYTNEIIVAAPRSNAPKTIIDVPYVHQKINFVALENINLKSFKAILNVFFKTPRIGWQIYKVMKIADHIHLRCPGNIGFIGCLVQILFPKKPKTAKYAGNWDPKAIQPWSYRLQKWMLSNTFLTKNMQVLVYGEWEGSTQNIKSFFTATYFETDKLPLKTLRLNHTIHFVFVGTLVSGKNPLYAIQLVEKLFLKGLDVTLHVYGEGIERDFLEAYIVKNKLEKYIFLEGNQNQHTIKEAYQKSHFVILPSKSEGWPKAVAEGMFWGCIPVATSVSCVPFMLDYGNRGIVLQMDLEKDSTQLETLLQSEVGFEKMRNQASQWSRKYTLDVFESEIEKLVRS